MSTLIITIADAQTGRPVAGVRLTLDAPASTFVVSDSNGVITIRAVDRVVIRRATLPTGETLQLPANQPDGSFVLTLPTDARLTLVQDDTVLRVVPLALDTPRSSPLPTLATTAPASARVAAVEQTADTWPGVALALLLAVVTLLVVRRRRAQAMGGRV